MHRWFWKKPNDRPTSLPHYHRNQNPLQFLLVGNPNWLEDVELPIEALYTPFSANFRPLLTLNQRYHWSMHCPPLGNTTVCRSLLQYYRSMPFCRSPPYRSSPPNACSLAHARLPVHRRHTPGEGRRLGAAPNSLESRALCCLGLVCRPVLARRRSLPDAALSRDTGKGWRIIDSA
jgi:hypothetical protein